jgi:hypothetical protein
MGISSCEVLGIFYDMGEMNALRGTFEKFDDQGINYRILMLGSAEVNALSSTYNKERLLFLEKDFQVERPTAPGKWEREDKFTNEELKKIKEKVKYINPFVIITGSVSMAQNQIALSIDVERLAHYGNINSTVQDNSAREVVSSFLNPNFHFLSPSLVIEHGARESFLEDFEISTIGHPGLDSFSKEVEKVDIRILKQNLNLSEGQKVLTFIGGYGEGYLKSFEYFLGLFKKLEGEADLSLIVQLHPRLNAFTIEDTPEFQALKKAGLTSRVILSQEDISTPEAVALSDLCLSISSTVIPQAAFCGKKTAFVNLEGTENLMTKAKVTQYISSKEELLSLLESCSSNFSKNEMYARAGIPLDASQKIYEKILESLEDSRAKALIKVSA